MSSDRCGPAAPRFPRRRLRARLLAAGAVVLAAAGAAIVFPLTAGHALPAGGWTIVNSPATGDGGSNILLGSTCANSQECWAVGVDILNISGPNSTNSPMIQEWNGTGWQLSAVPNLPSGGLFGVTCVDASDCWAVGAFTTSGQPNGPLAVHWDGQSWQAVPTPNVPGAFGAMLHGVTCTSPSDCWAVGGTTDDQGNQVGTIVLHWNGSAWSLGAPAATGQPYQQLNSVSCVSPTDCWAVGVAGPQQENSNFLPIVPGAVGDQGLIEHYDGTSWTVVPSYAATPPAGAWLSAVTCVAGDDCWTVGSTTDPTSGGPNGNLVEYWNGASWTVVPTPQNESANGILEDVTCLSAARCWAVGAGGAVGDPGSGQFDPAPSVVAWNGVAWSAEPSPNVVGLGLLDTVSCNLGDACWSAGFAFTQINSSNTQLQPLVEQLVLPPAANQGFVAAATDGGVFAFGNFPFNGSLGGLHLNRPVVGAAALAGGSGEWLAAADGGVFSFGSAGFYGSLGGMTLNRPIVGMAAAPDGRGYWLVGSDGGVFAFGSAKFYGSLGGADMQHPVVAIVSTPNGQGYWLVGSDGGVFAFGNAAYLGSVPGQGIAAGSPVIGGAATPSGDGYWLVGADGSVYTYGDATFLGSLVGLPLSAPVVAVSSG
jgi:hypothetical protein